MRFLLVSISIESTCTVNDLLNAVSQMNASYLMSAPLEVQRLYSTLPSNKRPVCNRSPHPRKNRPPQPPKRPTLGSAWLASMTMKTSISTYERHLRKLDKPPTHKLCFRKLRVLFVLLMLYKRLISSPLLGPLKFKRRPGRLLDYLRHTF